MNTILRRLSLATCLALAVPVAGYASTAYFGTWGGPAPAVVTFDMAGCRMTGENLAVTGYRMDPLLPAGAQPMLIGRVDDAGVPVWLQGVDLPGADYGHAIIETANSDLATAGYTMNPATGLFDMMITRFTRAGAPVYVRTLGAPASTDYAFSLAEDPTDNGLVVTGWSDNFTAGLALTLFKMTPAGAIAWGFAYGGALPLPALSDRGTYVTRLSDGGWAVTGWSQSLVAAGGAQDLLLMRVSPGGAILWVRTLGFGGPPATETEGRCVLETPDGGILVVGQTGVAGALGTRDLLVVKFSSGGGLIWSQTVGGPAEDFAHSVTLTDDGFAVAGYSNQLPNAEQAIVIGFNALGTPLWNRAIGLAGLEEFRSVALAGDGRLFVTGRGAAFGPGATNLIYGTFDPTGASCLGTAVPLVVASPPPIVIIQPIVSAPYPAAIVPAAAVIVPLPTLSTPICSIPSALAPYVNSFAEPAPAGLQARAIALTPATGGAVAGSVSPVGFPNWLIMRFDPLGNARWVKSYSTGGTSVEWGVGIARTVGGWYSLARTQAGTTAPRYPLLMKVDEDGMVVWGRQIGGAQAEPSAVIQTSDLGAAVAGWTLNLPGPPPVNERAFVSKFTSAGTHQWTTTLTGTNRATEARALMQASDGGYVIAGMDQNIAGGFPGLLVAKLDATGALVWSRALQMGTGRFDRGVGITETASGNYAVTGGDVTNATGAQNAILALLTPAGATVWTTLMQEVDMDQPSSLAARGDSLVFCGTSTTFAPAQQLVLAKANPAGDVVWMRALVGWGSNTGDAVAVTRGGEILAAGYSSFSSPTADLMLAKFNALGATCVGMATGYTPYFAHLPDMFFDPGLASESVTRTITSPAITDVDETVAMTNCPAPPTAVAETPLPLNGRALALMVASPASGALECRITTARATALRLSVFDLGGRRVGPSMSLGELSAGPHVVRLPMEGLPQGIYTAVVEGAGAIARAQFVFLRD